MKNSHQILEKYWGFTSFRPLQEDIILSVLNGKDTVALLPTGGGKSVCFQIPAMVMDGICIVVSPLVALMTDQVNALKQKGIKALQLSGGLKYDELNVLLDNAMYGNYKFLYISPERLQQELVQNCIQKMTVNLIAVDEAHCISQWGNDFRPAYNNINFLRHLHPLVPILALTATATPEVLADTISQLKLELPQVFRKSFVRENISYQVIRENDKLYRINQILKNNSDSAIIYVRNRRHAVETSNNLNAMGLISTFYHGGLQPHEKNEKLASWQLGSYKIMVATNAFGMGIDKANVCNVIHIQLPESIESYFQEAGRAGRNGEYAAATIIYSEYDLQLVKSQFIDALATPQSLKLLYKHLNNYFQIPYGEGLFSEYNFNFTQFCKQYSLNSLQTYNGLQTLDRLAVIKLSQEFGQKSILQFTVSSNQLLQYFEMDMKTSVIGKTILRLYSGIFESAVHINLELIASKTGQPISDIISVLQKLERDNMVQLKLRSTDASIIFVVPREDDKTINVLSKNVDLINTKKKSQVNAVLNYINNNEICKSVQLVTYFGEVNVDRCTICSVCVAQNSSHKTVDISAVCIEVIKVLEKGELSSRKISELVPYNENRTLQALQMLMDAKKLKMNNRNQYYLSGTHTL